MAFFLGLISITLIVLLISRWIAKGPFQNFWSAAQLATFIMFFQVGVMHLINPDSFIYMIEGWLPYPRTLIIVSGVTEVLFAIGLLSSRTRKYAAWFLIIQLIAMFPANINVAINSLSAPGGLPSDAWYVWSRLLFQPIYIWWVYNSALRPSVVSFQFSTVLLLTIVLSSFSYPTNSLFKVNITNIPEEGGDLYIGWYNKEEGFREVSKSTYHKVVSVKSNPSIIVEFDLIKTGTYAISVFLDQNKNGKLDRNFFGVPEEPYGFSNNYLPMMRAATFQEASFKTGDSRTLTIKLKD